MSLNCVHTYSGNSWLKKLILMLNDFAFDGTRMRSVNISGSQPPTPHCPPIDGAGQPGAFGSVPPFAASQSAGNGEICEPCATSPPGMNDGFVSFASAATPAARIATESPCCAGIAVP